MLYFDILEPIKVLPDADKGRLLVAMLEYGQTGVVPEFDGMLAMAWGFIRPKIDKDEAEYNMSVLRRQYATVCRERKKKGEPEITFDNWVKSLGSGEHHVVSMMTNDDQWYPTTTTSTTTSTIPSTTTSTSTTTAAAATTITNEVTAATASENVLKAVGGKLGQGVVFLTDAQFEDLLDKLGFDVFNRYMEKLANFIIKNDADVQNHYETILKWWRRDSGVETK